MVTQQLKLAVVAASLLPLAISCNSGPTSTVKAKISDNQMSPETDETLRAQVGLLATGSGACTAFVSAPNQITAAAHCLTGTQGGLADLKFTTASGQTSSITGVIQADIKKDYLALSTAETFSNVLSLGNVRSGNLTLVGYDAIKGDLFTDNCTLTKYLPSAGAFTHSCSTIAGMSGSPLLDAGKVVGIHLGFQPDFQQNVAFEVSRLNDPSTDVALVSIEDECGWGCGGDWHINTHPRNPLEGAGIGAVVGGLLGGGIVIGATVGALIGDHNLAQQKIAELRAQNANQAADLLQLKLDLSNEEAQHKADQDNATASNNCLKANGTAFNYVITHIDAAHQTFLNCLENAADNAASNACLSTYDNNVQAQLSVGKAIGGC